MMMRGLGHGSALTGLSGMSGAPATATLVEDAFADANWTLLKDHAIAPANPLGLAWVNQTGGLWVFDNTAQSGGNSTVDVARSDVVLTATHKNSGSQAQYVIGRWQDALNHWKLKYYGAGANEYAIVEVNAGAETVRASGTAGTNGAENTLEWTLSAATISGTCNGGTPISYGGAAFLQAQTKHGIGGIGSDYIDNFKAAG